MGTSASRATLARIRTLTLAAVLAALLAFSLVPVGAFVAYGDEAAADAEPSSEASASDGAASDGPADSTAVSDSSGPAQMLASSLVGDGTSVISADVALSAPDEGGSPQAVVGSFTVDGMTFSLSDDGVTLVAVAPDTFGVDGPDGGRGEVPPSGTSFASGASEPSAPSGPSEIPSMVSYGDAAYDVTAIGPYAFYLSGATEVLLPDSIATVDERAFRSSDVERVEVDPANPNIASFDGALYSADLSSLLLIPEGRAGSVSIPCEAEVVQASKFSHCSLVDAISVDGDGAAFASWDGLLYDATGTTLLRVPAGTTDITIREGCTTIAAGAMEGCAELESIDAPSTVTSISPDVFSQETPTVAPPAVFAADDDVSVAGRRGNLHQVSAVVSLTSAGKSLPGIDPDTIRVSLAENSSSAAWKKAGFLIDSAIDGNQSAEAEHDLALSRNDTVNASDLPIATLEKGDAFAGINATVTVNGNGQELSLDDQGVKTSASSFTVNCRGTNWFLFGRGAFHFYRSDEDCALGKVVEISIGDSPGYTFKGWSGYYPNGSLVFDDPDGYDGIYGETNTSFTFTAEWDKKPSFGVSLGKNGGSNGTSSIYYWPDKGYTTSSSSTTVVSAGSEIVSSLPTRSGYQFMGYWDVSNAAGGTCYIDADGRLTADAPELEGNSTWYARWGRTVTFDQAPGTGGTESAVVASGASISSIATPELSGWAFSGYTDDLFTSSYLYVKADGTGTTRTITGDKTLKANWTKTVTLNANGGTKGSLTSLTAGIGRPFGQKCAQVSSSDADYPIRSMFSKGIADDGGWAPTRDGYAFAGYWDKRDSTLGTCYIDAEGNAQDACRSVTEDMPSILYARWLPQSPLAFDANGGTWGYNGAGYSTEPKGLRATYGSDMPSPQDGMSPGGTYQNPTRTGYTFGGYWDAMTGGTQYYKVASDDVVESARAWDKNKTAGTTLYARWNANSYTVSFDANGGSGGQSSSVTATYGQAMPGISGTKPTRAGYVFEGWYDDPEGGIQYYTSACLSARAWDKDKDATLYARWSSKVATFDAAGGTIDVTEYPAGASPAPVEGMQGVPSCKIVWSGGSMIFSGGQTGCSVHYYPNPAGDGGILRQLLPKRAGYIQTGWRGVSADGSEERVISGASEEIRDGWTYTAMWEAKQSTVSFDANGGSGGQSSSVTATYGQAMPGISGTKPTRAGYVFEGWYDDPEGGIQYYTSACLSARSWDKDTIEPTALYAHWTGHEAVFDAAGGTIDVTEYPAGASPAPVEGMQGVPSCKIVWSGGSMIFSGGQTGCSVHYYPNPAGDGGILRQLLPKRAGYIQTGWRGVSADGSEERVISGASEEIRDGWTYTAMWALAVSVDVPIEVTAKVDLLGIEEPTEATGWIESRSGGALKVAEVYFEPLQGAADLFGSRTADVSLEAFAEGSASAGVSFALDAAASESDAAKLAPFALPDGYGTRVGVGYRFAIPDDVLSAIDPNRFTEVTTPVGQVVYTMALA